MTKSICFFNHKGGVSKTTTTYNLGWTLSKLGKRTLLVDLDPQCNLTGLVLSNQALDDEFMKNFYQNRQYITFEPIVEKIISGKIISEMANDGSIYPVDNQNLFLLAGSLNISELDSQITTALKITTGLPILGRIIANFFETLEKIAENNDIDYLLFDLSPSISGLNELALMGSDYFIVPTSPDYFCLQAIHSLSKKINQWHKEIEEFKKDTKIKIKNNPLFLGAIQQRYRLRNEAPTKSFEKWINEIRNAINSVLVNKLKPINCVITKELFSSVVNKKFPNLRPYDLAQIPDFNTLIAISQRSRKPVFLLDDDDLKTAHQFGKAMDTSKEKIKDFHKLFMDLGEIIINLTQSRPA
ncbi:ParA family protein [Helicobacter japonicus]|uniref:ParA family protein n=3 Tax=Helicobacter TaxID=209 RepID=UPI0025EC40FF|nr:AAA family ATPase [Helicobacter japonicus]